MSTTAPPAEIEVPREFLPGLIESATLKVCSAGNSAELTHAGLEHRAEFDAEIEQFRVAVETRAALLRALDYGAAVPVTPLLSACVETTILGLCDEVREAARGYGDLGAPRVDTDVVSSVVDKAHLLRDLTAWSDANGLREAVAV